MNLSLNKLRKYSLFGLLKLFLDLVKTRIFYRNSRLIRTPFYVRGGKNINFGIGLTTGVGVRLDALNSNATKVINIGDNVQLNDYVHIAAIQDVTIKRDVLIASHVFISDHNHGDFNSEIDKSVLLPPAARPLSSKPILIEESVWLGENVCILPGVTVGRNSIIGAGSVVTKNIDSWSIAVGNPAVIIKKYDFEKFKWVDI